MRRELVGGEFVNKISQNTSLLTDVLVRYRWLFVVPVVLPLSVLFDLYWAVRRFYYRRWKSAPEGHERRVHAIQDRVRRWRPADGGALLCTARKPWTNVSMRVVRYKHRDNTVRVDLHDILAIDPGRGIVRVEPGVTIGQLSRYLIPRGWTLPVVPELDDLTVGGLILGVGIEGSSHKYGLFADTVEACEVVIGPLITLIIYNPTKKSLRFDLTVVALLQLSAL
ncbi:MAG: FAD-dependent oxidoreductase, partial [Gemmatimonadetes bacterium]|nr:FAD-dependent oxidoreductase [Gemmatimonadota bacterium]